MDGSTIGQVLRQRARTAPDDEALVFPAAGFRCTFAEYDSHVDRAAAGLLAMGVEPGDHLAIWAPNIPEWPLLQLAVARAGAVLVTVNPAYRPRELAYVLEQADVRGIFLTERFKTTNYFDSLREVCPELATSEPGRLESAAFPELRFAVSLSGSPPAGMLAWREMLQLGEALDPGRVRERESGLSARDPAMLLYTSGTTGFPKGALLSHRNVLLNAYYLMQGLRATSADRICVPVPFYHCFGCVNGTLGGVVAGAAMLVPAEHFDAEATLDCIEKERATAVYGVPTMFINELEHPSFEGRDLSSLRTGIMAGSTCPVEVMKRVIDEMGAHEITIAYGLTEASPTITLTAADDPAEVRVETIGKPLPGVEVKIIDSDGRTLPDEVSGELCARGHNVMLGYHKMPDATRQAIDEEGWLHTGDEAARDASGYYRITGRIKDIIIRGGENISPREIEELLHAHPAVADAQVVGVPDAVLGEEICAWIRLHPGRTVTEEEIRALCRRDLAHFKVPKYVEFVDEFPQTVTGKVQKFKIRDVARERLGL